MYKLKRFTPISKDILKQGESYPYNIYRQVDDKIFSMLLEKNETFSLTKQSSLTNEKNIDLFIKAIDRDKYQQYIQENITNILNNEHIPVDSKAEFIHEIASATMHDLFHSELTSKRLDDINILIDNSVKLILREPKAMYSLLKVTSYDYYTYTHCIDVASYAIGFGLHLGFDYDTLGRLGKAAMLHDIGKKHIDHDIISKKGSLTVDEFEKIKRHPELSVQILRKLNENDELLLKTIEQHHEKCDGTGYPHSLVERQITDLAKIVSICDIFNALTTKRSYKDPMSTFEAFTVMFKDMKNGLSKKYLNEFVNFMGCGEDVIAC